MQEEIAKKVLENYSDFQKIAIPLIVLLSMNLAAFIGKFILDYILKNREIKIHRLNLISSRKVEILEKLFQQLEALSLFSSDQKELLLSSLQSSEQYINQNRLYISKKIFLQSNKILDYYKAVYFNYRVKNYEQETVLLDGFTKLFNS